MKNAEVSDLKKHIGFWMRMVSNTVSQSFSQKLEASGVTVAEWVVLREMYDHQGMIAPSLIAEVTGLTRGAISKLIERLVQKKLVIRQGSNSDRRYQEIHLTSEARKLVPKLGKLADENDDHFFSVLTKAEKKNLTETLQKLASLNKLKRLPIE